MPSKQLFIVRIALMTGVFMFAGFAMYQRGQGAPPTFGSELPIEMMQYALWILVGLSSAAALFLRPRVDSAPPQRRALMTLVGWSFGEGVALFGIVLHYIGAPIVALSLGLLAFIIALLLLPVPAESR